MNKLSKRDVGNIGEVKATIFLKKNKYKILATNYKTKVGEVDIICEKNEYIVFVEVKTRKKGSIDSGVFAVNRDKQKHIFNVADNYLRSHKSLKQPRFDIIEVEFDESDNSVNIKNHYVDAFIQGGSYAVF